MSDLADFLNNKTVPMSLELLKQVATEAYDVGSYDPHGAVNEFDDWWQDLVARLKGEFRKEGA